MDPLLSLALSSSLNFLPVMTFNPQSYKAAQFRIQRKFKNWILELFLS